MPYFKCKRYGRTSVIAASDGLLTKGFTSLGNVDAVLDVPRRASRSFYPRKRMIDKRLEYLWSTTGHRKAGSPGGDADAAGPVGPDRRFVFLRARDRSIWEALKG